MTDQETQAPKEVQTFVLVRYWIRDKDPDQAIYIPRSIKANVVQYRNVPPQRQAEDQLLRRMGLAELIKIGRVRPGHRDTGDQIELPSMTHFTTMNFFDTLPAHGLKIVSISRKVETIPEKRVSKHKTVQAHNRHVVTIGIGWGEAALMSVAVERELQGLVNLTWQDCHVWNNERPRSVGGNAVDTINLVSPLVQGEVARHELVLDSESALKLMPVGETHLSVRTPLREFPAFLKA